MYVNCETLIHPWWCRKKRCYQRNINLLNILNLLHMSVKNHYKLKIPSAFVQVATNLHGSTYRIAKLILELPCGNFRLLVIRIFFLKIYFNKFCDVTRRAIIHKRINHIWLQTRCESKIIIIIIL
jgi:hypothetical protein